MKSSAHNNEFDIIWQVTFRFKLSLNAWLWKSDQGSPSTTPPKTDLNGFWLPGYNNGAIYNLTNYAISTWQAHAADPQGSHTPSLIDSIRCPGDIEMRSWRARCHSWLAVSYSCNADVCTRMSTSSVCQIAPAVRTHYKWPIFDDLVVGDRRLDFHIQVFDESLKTSPVRWCQNYCCLLKTSYQKMRFSKRFNSAFEGSADRQWPPSEIIDNAFESSEHGLSNDM